MLTPSYSLVFNEKKATWVAKIKHPITHTWMTKWLPKSFLRSNQIDAERFLLGWYQDFISSGGVNVPKASVVSAKKTIALLASKWLELQYQRQDLSRDTYRGYKCSVNNWILNNPKFPHHPIQDLDIETELTVSEVRSWIYSLRTSFSSKLAHITALKGLLDDAGAEGWVSEDYTSPFAKKPIRKMIKDLNKKRRSSKVQLNLSLEQVDKLLSGACPKLQDFRRMRYLVAIGTGLRDHEIQGLTWNDVDLSAPLPHVKVERQLKQRGALPFALVENLVEKSLTKDQIATHDKAVCDKPKYDSRRAVPLHPLVVLGLQWWKETGWQKHVGRTPVDQDPVFARSNVSLKGNEEAGHFCKSDGPELLRKDLERLGLSSICNGEQLDFHALRHTFATLLNNQGIDDAKIGALMGHKAKTVTRGTYIDAKDLRAALSIVERLPLPSTLQLQNACLSLAEESKTEKIAS